VLLAVLHVLLSTPQLVMVVVLVSWTMALRVVLAIPHVLFAILQLVVVVITPLY